jgi:1-acyl-sn-glycerol-3-phosphate acyltransferase
MSLVRALLRSLAFAAFTAGTALVLLGGHAVTAGATRARWNARVQRFWSRGLVRIFGATVSVEGDVPTGARLLVSNHVSYIDVMILATLTDCAFVAKSDVARWPVLGYLARAVDTVFVDRDRRTDVARVTEAMRGALAHGRSVVLFPEGTSTDGSQVLPFKSSLLEPAASGAAPLTCCAVAYRTPEGSPPARDAVAWWGDMTFLRHFFDLLRLPGFEAKVVFAPGAPHHADRKVLAEALCTTVRQLHRRAAFS